MPAALARGVKREETAGGWADVGEWIMVRMGPTILITLALSVAAGAAQARDTQARHGGSFSVGVGAFNMGHSHPSDGFGLEYRLDSRAWRPRESGRFSLIPTFGIRGTIATAFAINTTIFLVVEVMKRISPEKSVRPGYTNSGGPTVPASEAEGGDSRTWMVLLGPF